ncbi:hypothetical protein [Acidiferrobacter sp.]|uniref:hypothetical protein n=1 Tax=Acidiferrobacter sp. TaxID=1872107 RepID=UPI00263813CE|nr:hypothetical protein [Acidiferrobacter sp.]
MLKVSVTLRTPATFLEHSLTIQTVFADLQQTVAHANLPLLDDDLVALDAGGEIRVTSKTVRRAV